MPSVLNDCIDQSVTDPSRESAAGNHGRQRLAIALVADASTTSDAMTRTWKSIQGLRGSCVVFAAESNTWLEHYARREGFLVVDKHDALPDCFDASTAPSSSAPWCLRLRAGEILSAESCAKITEIARLDLDSAPPAFRCQVFELDEQSDPASVVRQRDEIRLYHRSLVPNRHANSWPVLAPGCVRRGVDCAVTDIAIHRRFLKGVNSWHANDYPGVVLDETRGPGDTVDLAERYLRTGNPERAMEPLESALASGELDPSERAFACALLIRANRQRRDDAGWQAAIERARKEAAGHGLVLYETGKCWHLARDFSRAIGCYRAAMEARLLRGAGWWDHTVTNHKARHQYALALLQQGHVGAAGQQWKQVLQEVPRFAPAHAGLCEVLIHQQAMDKAIECALLIQQFPELFAIGVLARVRIAEQVGDIQEARRQLERGLRQEPGNDDLLQTLGAHVMRFGPPEEIAPIAEECLRRRQRINGLETGPDPHEAFLARQDFVERLFLDD
jgi:tetratricopeptide (TPR) repeat protein